MILSLFLDINRLSYLTYLNLIKKKNEYVYFVVEEIVGQRCVFIRSLKKNRES